jgi:hypothetical protein
MKDCPSQGIHSVFHLLFSYMTYSNRVSYFSVAVAP